MDQSLSFRDVLGVLRRQLKLIVLCVVLLLSLTAAYVFTATPVYRATALVLFDPSQRGILDNELTPALTSSAEVTRIESEVEIMQSPATTLALVKAENLVSDAEFGPKLSLWDKAAAAVGLRIHSTPTGEQLLQQVLSRVTGARDVRREGLTYLISASFESTSPKRAAELANALANIHIKRQVDSKIAASLAARDVLQDQSREAQQNLASSEDALNAFVDDNLEKLEADSGSQAVADLRARLNQSEVNRLASQVVAEQANAALADQDWQALSQTLQDQAITQLNNQRAALERQLASATSDQPLATSLRNQLNDIEQELSSRSSSAISSLNVDIEKMQSQSDDYRESIRSELLADRQLPSETLAQLFSLQQEANIARTQYQSLLERVRSLEAQASVQLADSRIVSEALPPDHPRYPNKKLLVALALVVGTAAGVALAFMNEFLLGGITSADQLATITQSDVAVTIPAQSGMPKGQQSVADLIIRTPLSVYSESVRKVRTSTDEAFRKRGTGHRGRGRVVLVCSSVPAEGKSTTAIALGRTYASAGSKVIIVDADLRRPSIHNYLGLRPAAGLFDFLTSEESHPDWGQIVLDDPLSSCKILPGRSGSSLPTDQMLASNRMEMLVGRLLETFDIVVVDSPPLVPVVDARYLARMADAVIMVVRFASTTQAEVREAVASLRGAMAPEIPMMNVLNLASMTRGAYYRYRGYYAA